MVIHGLLAIMTGMVVAVAGAAAVAVGDAANGEEENGDHSYTCTFQKFSLQRREVYLWWGII